MYIEGKNSILSEEQNLTRVWISNEFLKSAEKIEKSCKFENSQDLKLEIDFIETARAFYEGKSTNFNKLDSSEVYDLVLKTIEFSSNNYDSFFQYTKLIKSEFELVMNNRCSEVKLLKNFLRKIAKELLSETANKKLSNYLINEESDYYEFVEQK